VLCSEGAGKDSSPRNAHNRRDYEKTEGVGAQRSRTPNGADNAGLCIAGSDWSNCPKRRAPLAWPLLDDVLSGKLVPFYSLALQALPERNAEIRVRGVTLLAISPQTPDHSLAFQEKHSLEFSVLSDAGNKVARHFRIVFSLDPGFRTVQEQFGVDIPAYNGGTFELPVPATSLMSRDGKVLKSYAEADYMQRLAPETALEWLCELWPNAVNPALALALNSLKRQSK
jgi:peroxiredoxin